MPLSQANRSKVDKALKDLETACQSQALNWQQILVLVSTLLTLLLGESQSCAAAGEPSHCCKCRAALHHAAQIICELSGCCG